MPPEHPLARQINPPGAGLERGPLLSLSVSRLILSYVDQRTQYTPYHKVVTLSFATGRRAAQPASMSETQRHTHRVSPDFTPGKPRKPALHGGGVMHLTLPPIISPRTVQAPARSRNQMPWGGRAPQPWMMSPRESTYKRQCVDTEAFHLNKFQAERESIRMAFGEGSELMKTPRERTREMLEKRPVEVTDILKKQAFVSDIFQRRPPPDHENADIIQAAPLTMRADPLLQGKAGWRNPGSDVLKLR